MTYQEALVWPDQYPFFSLPQFDQASAATVAKGTANIAFWAAAAGLATKFFTGKNKDALIVSGVVFGGILALQIFYKPQVQKTYSNPMSPVPSGATVQPL